MSLLKQKSQPIDLEIGKIIAGLRRANGFSQERLGEALGVTFQQVQKYEKGTNRISVSALVRICKTLGIHPMDVIGQYFGSAPETQASALVGKICALESTLAQIKRLAA